MLGGHRVMLIKDAVVPISQLAPCGRTTRLHAAGGVPGNFDGVLTFLMNVADRFDVVTLSERVPFVERTACAGDANQDGLIDLADPLTEFG